MWIAILEFLRKPRQPGFESYDRPQFGSHRVQQEQSSYGDHVAIPVAIMGIGPFPPWEIDSWI